MSDSSQVDTGHSISFYYQKHLPNQRLVKHCRRCRVPRRPCVHYKIQPPPPAQATYSSHASMVFPIGAQIRELAADHLDRLPGKSLIDRLVHKSSVANDDNAASTNQPKDSGER